MSLGGKYIGHPVAENTYLVQQRISIVHTVALISAKRMPSPPYKECETAMGLPPLHLQNSLKIDRTHIIIHC